MEKIIQKLHEEKARAYKDQERNPSEMANFKTELCTHHQKGNFLG